MSPKLALSAMPDKPDASGAVARSTAQVSKADIPQVKQAVNKLPPKQSSNPTSSAAITLGKSNHFYAGGFQWAKANGVSATISQELPYVQPNGGHSLIELAAHSADGNQIIETGWMVDKTVNGDTLPHLFVFRWERDGEGRKPACYNGCGFVSTSETTQPGDMVKPGESATYGIVHKNDRWNVSYNNEVIGYYPDSLWNGEFTQMDYVDVFGEVGVVSTDKKPCDDMGTGDYADSPDAAQISNIKLLGTTKKTKLVLHQSDPALYTANSVSATALRLGGAGAC